MKKLAKTAALMIALSCAIVSPANAGALCPGVKITQIENYFNGYVFLHTNIGKLGICSVQDQHGSVTPATCQGWLSLAMTSYVRDRPIQLYFNDGVENCSFYDYQIRQPQSILFLQ